MIPQEFQQSLLKGYVSNNYDSRLDLLPEFLINDKRKNQKVLTTILHELKACDEFWFSVAFLTTSGLATLMSSLELLSQRKVKGKIVVSNYLNFTQPLALERLLNNFPEIDLRVVEEGNYHAKGYLFRKADTYNMIIGSSNLTSSALTINKEWNLKISARRNSYLMQKALSEFKSEFSNATPITHQWIYSYSKVYEGIRNLSRELMPSKVTERVRISPNSMQTEALKNLAELRENGATKALLISATGTGKTYLSAFDVASLRLKKCLFLVHRRTIAEKALNSFKEVLGDNYTYGLYSGNIRESDSNFLFSTIQTMSRENHLEQFDRDSFDYIIIDETHRAGAETYSKVIDYFTPKFLLGMTATPERTDGLDIFSLFDHNIAYEIRLHRAMEEEMLSEFHYYGVQDITVDGKIIDDNSEFRFLEADERINHIITTSKRYGTDNGVIRGLVFCSRKEECKALSDAFNSRGYRSVALTGDNSENERKEAIELIESDGESRLDYIFTVDIFNEGIDIPKINQILMLRPTNSAIIFIQQLGRGLRKSKDKKYLTVIDFIGNYQNNYLVPIALYGDKSYNKDTLRKIISEGSLLIPGASTINFDAITKAKIYKSIDAANMQIKRDLIKDYDLLKFKLGRQPMMMDFIEHGSRDPFHYVSYSNSSFFEFAAKNEPELLSLITGDDLLLLKYFSKEINNAKRVAESIVLLQLIEFNETSFDQVNSELESRFGYTLDIETFESVINNLKLNFVTENHDKKLKTVAEIYGFNVVELKNNVVNLGNHLSKALTNEVFRNYLLDNTNYSIYKYSDGYDKVDYNEGFIKYRKYSRKDVFRVLNWDKQPLAQNVGGYMFHPDDKNCPIFVNYHKEEDISDTTKYEDGFIDMSTIIYMSKSKRKLTSPDVVRFQEATTRGIRLPLFIKKENAEGDDFYYMGEVTPKPDTFTETTIGEEKPVSIVKMTFHLDQAVEPNMFRYITKNDY